MARVALVVLEVEVGAAVVAVRKDKSLSPISFVESEVCVGGLKLVSSLGHGRTVRSTLRPKSKVREMQRMRERRGKLIGNRRSEHQLAASVP
jgi:hypothetical protein